MPTENILLKFTSDLSGLKSASDELVKMGKLTEEDKKKFDTLLGTIEGIDDALKEAGVEASKFSKEVAKGADSGKSLRGQLADAKNEAVRLSQAFGPFSKEAREAAKRAAEIKDEIADLNDTLDALNPEAKLNAFVKLGQGVQGAFQVATGALQVFGVENERITKLAQQFQGVLNVTEGINSVLQLKDVYGQLRLVLGVTTTAQKGLNTAMLANPAGIIIASVAALVTTIILLNDKTEEYRLTEEELTRIKKDAIGATEGLQAAEDALAIKRNKNATFDIERRKNKEELEKDLLLLFDNQRLAAQELGEAERKRNELGKGASINLKNERDERLKLAQQVKADADAAIENRKAEFFATNELIRLKELEATTKKKAAKEDRDISDDQIELLKSIGLETIRTKEDVIKLTDEGYRRLQDVLRIVEANAFAVKGALVAVNDELKNLQPVSVTVTTTATKLNQELFKNEDELTKKIAEENEKRKQEALQTFNIVASGSQALASAITSFNDQLYANDLANLQKSLEDGYLTQEQYENKVKALKIKQFEENKKISIAQTIIATAQAVVNALNIVPVSAAPAAAFFAAATGALNLAKILSTEAPSFKKGTLRVKGGNFDSDGGVLAVVHPDESIIPPNTNREYHPAIKAIFNRQIKASEINGFVEARLKGKIPNSIDAKIDHRKLGQMLKGNNAVELTNAKMVGKVIARELSKTMDIRRQ